MATFDPNIFRAYDVRGIWGRDFDAQFAQHLGSRVASHLKSGIIVIGRDSRVSSDEITYAVIDGALHTGATVIDVGQVSSPQFYWAIRTLGAIGGIMVTASHNPPAYNGFKVIGQDVQVLGGDRIRQIFDSHPHTHRTDGTVQFKDIIPEYASAIAQAASWNGEELQMSIDGPSAVRRALECIAPIAPDHGLAARFDPDGDRIAFFVNGKPIAPDWMFLLLTEELALEPVVMDLRFSKAVRERLERYHVKYAISRVGRLYMVENMRTIDAMFGAEMSGHYYYKQFGGMEAPELMLLQVASILAKHGKGLDSLVKHYMQYHKSEEISIPVADRKAVDRALARVRNVFGDEDIDTLDGMTVRRRDWWFNVRPSNTEPVLRLVVEAKEKDLLEEKVRTITTLLNRAD